MIRIFSSNDKVYNSNGEIVVQPLKAKVHKEDNGDYYINLETSIKYANYLVSGNLVVADTPQGAQAFRISDVTKKSSKISLKAWHVFYDSKNYLIADSYVVNRNCNEALDHLNRATEPTSEFLTLSDVTTIDSYRCVRKSLYEAVQTILERWGGHLVRDNFNIKIMQNIGVDNGVTVRYAKNLKELTCEENWDNVVTKLLPVGKDGILLNAIDSNEDIYMTSKQQWDIPFTKTVYFQQDSIVEEDYADEASYKKALVKDLREQARDYLNKNSVPQVNYVMKANLEYITDIGDTVEVIDERLNVHLLTNVIAYEYDCILEKFTEIEFGNFRRTIEGFASSVVNSATQSAKDEINGAMQNTANTITQNITGSFTSSYVQYDGTKILILDSIPKEVAKNVILINNNGIAFSDSGINGNFASAWSIDGTLNMQAINVINLICDMIKGGTLKLGTALNQSGNIELYNESNKLICTLDKNGIIMYATNGGYVVLNQDVGLVGYDSVGNPIYWVSDNEFHMNKAVVENDINIANKVRFIPITITDSEGNIVNDGIGLVSAYSESEVLL